MSGRVVDRAGAVLQGARVTLDPIGFSTGTDGQGLFIIRDLPSGTYTVRVDYVGFSEFTTSVQVNAGQAARVDATLTVASKAEEVMVYAEQPRGQAEAINRERAADNILQVLTADVITSLPNANIADAVGRMPSVTLERDEGEGKYVQIRGTEPRLSNVTIDGINVPSPEGGVRQVKLDTIPADVVESVEINKTLQPDIDGDGIGGSVNLVTKTAGDSPTISAYGLGGYTPIVNGRYVDQAGATIGKRFGARNQWGALLGGTYDYNQRGIDDIEPVPTGLPGSTGFLPAPAFATMDLREYAYYRTRWGLAGSTDYKFREDSSIWVRGLYSDFKDYGDRWAYTLNDINLPGGDSAPGYNTSARRPDYAIANLALGGKHMYTTQWFAWTASFARARQTASSGNPGADFAYVGPTSQCTYDAAATSNSQLPQWSPVCYQEAYNSDNFTLDQVEHTFGQTAQVNLLGAFDYARNFHLGGHFSTLQTGFKFRNANKYDNGYVIDYSPIIPVAMTKFVGNFKNTDYYNQHYQFGPAADWNMIESYLAGDASNFDSSTNNVNGANDSNFNLKERVYGGYIMDTTDFGHWRLMAGVRIEGTQTWTKSYSDVTNQYNVYGEGSYVNVLPDVSLRWAINPASGLRFVYSQGVARPDPQDLTSAVSFDGVNTYSIGNPALKAERARNVDLLYEQYLQPLGMIQAGFFYKYLNNPIIQTQYKATSGQYAGYFVDSPGNAGNAWLAGIELSYQQQWSRLPGLLSGFGMFANWSYTGSNTFGVPGHPTDTRLQRQAPVTWNISPSFDKGRLSARLGLSYNGANIYSYYGGDSVPEFGPHGPNGDTWLYSHLQIDVQAGYRVYRGLQAMFYGLNLNNEVFGFYNGSPQYTLQREYYKPTYAGGLRYTYSRERR